MGYVDSFLSVPANLFGSAIHLYDKRMEHLYELRDEVEQELEHTERSEEKQKELDENKEKVGEKLKR